jgi:hypothetical protein
MKKKSDNWKRTYDVVQTHVINDIKEMIIDREDSCVDITETRGIPSLVTEIIDDQLSETIDSVYVKDNEVYASASAWDKTHEYNLNTFDTKFLIAILESIEKHIEQEEMA